MELFGKAYVKPASSETNPDAYLLIGIEGGSNVVLKVGWKADITSLETLADALNKWASSYSET